MKSKLWFAGISLVTGTSFAAAPTMSDFDIAMKYHAQYTAAMYQVFMDSPSTADVAKVAVHSKIEPIIRNSATTVAYESMIIDSDGAVCNTPVADRIPQVLIYEGEGKAIVMFNAGTIQYVNVAFFRDLCVLYRRDPNRVSDLYNQQMTQLKAQTGGKTYKELYGK